MTAAAHLLDTEERKYLHQLVNRDGLNIVAGKLNVSRGVISSALARISVRKGSIEMLRAAIAKHREQGAEVSR